MDPIKAPFDDQAYKSLNLTNGLKAILISTLPQPEACSDDDACKFTKIWKFNKKHLNLSYDLSDPDTGGICCGGVFSRNGRVACHEDCKPNPPPVAPEIDLKEAQACASLTIGVGSLMEPPEYGGLAHFAEHCAFLGSKKYPGPTTLRETNHMHGGSGNAVTESMSTSYFFTSKASGFPIVLDIFAHGIFSPTLDPSDLDKEIEAVDSEHAMKKTGDHTRVCDFQGFLSKHNHPLGTFSWGNRETLKKPEIAEVTRKWHEKWYKPNLCTLSVIGPFTFDRLEQMVQDSFAGFPRDDCLNPEKSLLAHGFPFEPQRFHKLYNFMPVEDRDWIMISWALPVHLAKDLDSQPLLYLKMIFESLAEGGIVHYLRSQSLATALNCHVHEDEKFNYNPYCSMFKIIIYLTPKGFENREQVFVALKSYIKFHRSIGPHKESFENLRRMRASAFHFNSWEDEYELVQAISRNLQYTEPKFVLMTPLLIKSYRPDLITEALKNLRMNEANIIVVSRKFQDVPNVKNLLRAYEYREYPIPPEWFSETEGTIPFVFPPPTTPQQFLLKDIAFHHPLRYLQLKPGEDERVLFDDGKLIKSRLTRMPPDEKTYSKRLPWGTMDFTFRTTRCEMRDFPLVSVWIGMMEDICNSKINSPLIGDTLYRYVITRELGMMKFHFEGPSFQLSQFGQLVLTTFTTAKALFPGMEQAFLDHKFMKIQDLQCELTDNHEITTDLLGYLLEDLFLTRYSDIAKLQNITFRHFINFIEDLQYKMKIDLEFCGDISQSDASEFLTLIGDMGEIKKLTVQKTVKDRNTMLGLGKSILRIRSPSPNLHTTVIANHYQFGILEKKQIAVWRCICRYLKLYLFHQLRFRQMLSYNIRVNKWHRHSNYGLTIRVTHQPSKVTSVVVEEKITNTLAECYRQLFKTKGNFDGSFPVVPRKDMTRKEFRETAEELFQDYLLPGGNQFRKLSVQVEGYHPHQLKEVIPKPCEGLKGKRAIQIIYDKKKPKDEGWHFVSDITVFKSTLDLRGRPRISDNDSDYDADDHEE